MLKEVVIHEQGVVFGRFGNFLVVTVVVSHNKHVIEEKLYKVPYNASSHAVAKAFAEMFGAGQWRYQSMWTLQQLEDKASVQASFIDIT